MNGITTHVLDTTLGQPAQGLSVVLERSDAHGQYLPLFRGVTDSQGRIGNMLGEAALAEGSYRLCFDTEQYLERVHRVAFYPRVEVMFRVLDGAKHHHIPLLLSPFGYSTYRGS